MSEIGLTNIKMSTDGVIWQPVGEVKDIKLETDGIDYQWNNIDITKPIQINGTIRAKKKGTILEKCLYYQKSKKKRIRKKWSLEKILIGKW